MILPAVVSGPDLVEAQQRLREAEARRAALARQIAALIESAGITTSSPGSTAGASELRRYRLVRKIKDGRPAADGEPDPAHPILIDGQPVNYANRQTKLSPSAAYRAAVRVEDEDQDDDIQTVALIDANAGNAVISTNITWGSVRGR